MHRLAHFFAALAASLVLPTCASAEDFQKIGTRSEFLDLLGGRELRLPLYGVRIRLSPDGGIDGSALGWGLTGRWDWQDGYFCRSIDWSGSEIPFNCQLVEAQGSTQVRFTVDRGTGDSAEFRLR